MITYTHTGSYAIICPIVKHITGVWAEMAMDDVIGWNSMFCDATITADTHPLHNENQHISNDFSRDTNVHSCIVLVSDVLKLCPVDTVDLAYYAHITKEGEADDRGVE